MGVRKRLLKKELRISKSADEQFLYEDQARLQRIRYQRTQANRNKTKLHGEYKNSTAQFSVTFLEYTKMTEAKRKRFKSIGA